MAAQQRKKIEFETRGFKEDSEDDLLSQISPYL